MDRRSFLKALGTAPLAGCSVASVAEAAHPLMGDVLKRETEARIPSMKVIGMGRSGLGLMRCMLLPIHVRADCLAIRFNGRITRGIQLPDMEWTAPLIFRHHWREYDDLFQNKVVVRQKIPGMARELSDDLQNMAAMKQRIPGMERELSEYVKGADIVLLLVSLDNAMSFAACDAVAKIARNSGALVVVLAGAPYGGRNYISDESLRMASHDAVNRVLNEADCVFASEGLWTGSTTKSVCWDFSFSAGFPCTLLSAAWATSITGGSFNELRRVLSGSGRAVYGFGTRIGEETIEEVIKRAFEYRDSWLGSYGKTEVASSGVIIVSAPPKSVNARLDEVRAELAHIEPLKMPQRGDKPKMLLLANPDNLLRDNQFFSLNIISTGIEFIDEA